MKNLIECPICKAPIHYKRVDDDIVINEIGPYGEVIELSNESDGYEVMYCSKNKEHQLPLEIYQTILDLIN